MATSAFELADTTHDLWESYFGNQTPVQACDIFIQRADPRAEFGEYIAEHIARNYPGDKKYEDEIESALWGGMSTGGH